MICSIISIGTELNLGLIVDMNSKYIAGSVADLGMECRCMYTVGDDIDDISDVLKQSLECSDLVMVNGGLGPTDDDVTRRAVARSLNIKLVRDKSLNDTSVKFVRDRKKRKLLKGC
ncbi:MAG: molybdopterin-binding protein [Actinomycetota bacterium]|nr:molybdopterin-binding protein [Actinomycetota bacterium]